MPSYPIVKWFRVSRPLLMPREVRTELCCVFLWHESLSGRIISQLKEEIRLFWGPGADADGFVFREVLHIQRQIFATGTQNCDLANRQNRLFVRHFRRFIALLKRELAFSCFEYHAIPFSCLTCPAALRGFFFVHQEAFEAPDRKTFPHSVKSLKTSSIRRIFNQLA